MSHLASRKDILAISVYFWIQNEMPCRRVYIPVSVIFDKLLLWVLAIITFALPGKVQNSGRLLCAFIASHTRDWMQFSYWLWLGMATENRWPPLCFAGWQTQWVASRETLALYTTIFCKMSNPYCLMFIVQFMKSEGHLNRLYLLWL